jgi:hypothetical protein
VPPPPGTTPRLTISKAGTQGAPAVGLWGNVAGRAIRRAYNRAGIAGVRKGRAIATVGVGDCLVGICMPVNTRQPRGVLMELVPAVCSVYLRQPTLLRVDTVGSSVRACLHHL